MRDRLLQIYPEALIHRLDAVVGKEHILSEQEKVFFRNSDFLASPHFLNIVGNCLSHYRAWEEAARQGSNSVTLIMQDDAILISSFRQHLEEILAQLPADALALFIADHIYAVYEKFVPVDLEHQDLSTRLAQRKEPITSLIAKYQDIWADHCSLAYLVTPQGATELLSYTKQNGFSRAADRYLRDVMVGLGKNYCSVRCLVTSSSELFTSDIWGKAVTV